MFQRTLLRQARGASLMRPAPPLYSSRFLGRQALQTSCASASSTSTTSFVGAGARRCFASWPPGPGHTPEFAVDTERPWQLNAVTSRLSDAPQGVFGGEPGSAGRFMVNGQAVETQARITLSGDDVVRLELPGGGGYGAPEDR